MSACLGEKVDDFAFAFVAPLGADEDGICHGYVVCVWVKMERALAGQTALGFERAHRLAANPPRARWNRRRAAFAWNAPLAGARFLAHPKLPAPPLFLLPDMKFFSLLLLAATFAHASESAPVSFRNHVQPILAKFGCSLGACHGAAAGQGGFRLSLRGYDDEGDFLTLTRGAFGRRITPADPARSLLLLKPTNAVPHKGGEKFAVDSPEWRTLVEWIAQGAPGPREDDPRIQRLTVEPEKVTLEPGKEQQFIVRAFFSDGHVEDVTRHVKFTATNQAVINVDDFGAVKVIGHGESAVTAWYLSQIAVGTVTAPFPPHARPGGFRPMRRAAISSTSLVSQSSRNSASRLRHAARMASSFAAPFSIPAGFYRRRKKPAPSSPIPRRISAIG